MNLSFFLQPLHPMTNRRSLAPPVFKLSYRSNGPTIPVVTYNRYHISRIIHATPFPLSLPHLNASNEVYRSTYILRADVTPRAPDPR